MSPKLRLNPHYRRTLPTLRLEDGSTEPRPQRWLSAL